MEGPLNFVSGYLRRLWSEWSPNIRAVFMLIAMSFVISLTVTTFGDVTGNVTIANFGVHTSTVCKLLAIAYVFAEGAVKNPKLLVVSRMLLGLSLIYAILTIAHLYGQFPWLDGVTTVARNFWVTIVVLIIIYMVTAFRNNVFSNKTDTEVQDDMYNDPN